MFDLLFDTENGGDMLIINVRLFSPRLNYVTSQKTKLFITTTLIPQIDRNAIATTKLPENAYSLCIWGFPFRALPEGIPRNVRSLHSVCRGCDQLWRRLSSRKIIRFHRKLVSWHIKKYTTSWNLTLKLPHEVLLPTLEEPNKMTQVLTLLIRIREVPVRVSNRAPIIMTSKQGITEGNAHHHNIIPVCNTCWE